MIFQSINFLSVQLNQYFRSKLNSNEDIVVISNLVNLDGSVANNIDNKLIITMVNLANDLTLRNNSLPNHSSNYKKDHLADFNSHLLITANFSQSNYVEALNLLSNVIECFQDNFVFTKETSPNLPFGLKKLVVTMVNVAPEQLNHIWSLHGGNYMPSVFYKIIVA